MAETTSTSSSEQTGQIAAGAAAQARQPAPPVWTFVSRVPTFFVRPTAEQVREWLAAFQQQRTGNLEPYILLKSLYPEESRDLVVADIAAAHNMLEVAMRPLMKRLAERAGQ